MLAQPYPDEAKRLEALRDYGVLDTGAEREFDDLVALAARICETPVSLVSLVDSGRQWFKATEGTRLKETALDVSFCAHAILEHGVFEIPDTTLDPRTQDNALVTGEPHLRFYAGTPLETADGLPLGTLCVIDMKPRRLTELQRETLRVLGEQVMARLELRRNVRQLETEKAARSVDEAFLRLVTDRLPVRVGYLDREYRYRFVNGAYERAFGLPPGGGVGKTVAELTGEESFRIAKPFLDRALSGDTHTQEFTVPYAFGTRRVEVQYVADRDEAGEVRGVVIHVVDVTDRFAMTEALREREERYRTLFDSLEEGFCVLEMIFDEAGKPFDYRFREINDAFVEHSTICREDALHKTMREIAPNHEQVWYDRYGHVATTGEPLIIEDRAEALGRWYSIHAFRIGGEGSLEVGALFKDVTDERLAQSAIDEERARQDRTLETAQVATFDFDVPNGRVYANPLLTRFFGVSEADAKGGPIEAYFAAIHSDDREATISAIGASLESGRAFETQYRVSDEFGRERWVLARGDTTLDPEGRPIRLSGVVLDITDRVRADEARQASERKVRGAFDLLEGIIEGTSEVMVSVDCDFRFTAMNEAFRETIRLLFDRTPEVGGDLLKVLSDVPEDHAKAKSLWERALGGEEVSVREWFGDPGHTRSVFDLRFYPIRNAAGVIVGAAEIARDVTERARAEAERERLLSELEVERGKLETLFRLAPAFIAVLRGRDLVFEYVNDAYYSIVGHRPIVGRPLAQAIPEVVGGEEGRDYDRLLLGVMDSGEVLTFVERPATLQRTPGGPFEERFLDLSYQPLREADGSISGVLVHGIDVTAQVLSRRAISEREELFRTVFEQAPDDAILVMDADRTITAWNPAAERITQWTSAEAIGQAADLIFTPEDCAAGAPESETSSAARNGKAEDERWHLRKDGTRFWGSGTMNALHADDGGVRGYLKVFRDTTERYVETQTLAFLSLLTEAVIDEREPDAIIETVERMLGRYLGAARVAFVEVAEDGESLTIRHEWAPEVPGLLGTHRLRDFGPTISAELQAGRIHVSRDAIAESRLESGLDAVRRFSIGSGVSVPVMMEGRLASVVVVHQEAPRDWTSDEVGLIRQVADRMSAEIERARAEAALRASEEKFRQLVDLSPSTVWFGETDGDLSYISQDFYDATGLAPESALPTGWASTVHPEDLPRVTEEWAAAIRDETIYDTEFRIRHRDGVYRWISARAVPMRDEDGRITGWLGSNSDIHERKTSEETLRARVDERTAELQRAVQEAEGFNYSISHDLRTPLRAMVSTASILLEELGSELDDEHRMLLGRQADNAKRMGRLIDELLRLSRLARVPVNREPLDITDKARSVVEEIRQSGEDGGCPIEVQEGMKATGDAGLVRTVFHNLIGNACKFSPKGSVVRVGQEEGTFFVRDEGVGFDMKYAPKIFLPFERLVLETEFPGTGIGLANVKRIVERHGGKVWVESAPDKGATFFFTLE